MMSGNDERVSDEEACVIKIADAECFIKGLRALLDEWGVPHTCPDCGTEDVDDIIPYDSGIWKCQCGHVWR